MPYDAAMLFRPAAIHNLIDTNLEFSRRLSHQFISVSMTSETDVPFTFSTDLELGPFLDLNDIDCSMQPGPSEPPPPPAESLFQDSELIGGSQEDFGLLNNLANVDDDTPHRRDNLATSSPSPQTGKCSTVLGSSNSKQPPQPQRKRRVRVSTKAQMDNLRETVEELTATVQALETDQLHKKAEAQRKKSTGDVARQTMWKKIARRQLEKRRKAEQDNATLRVMLKMQIEEAKSLTRILKRRQRIEELEAMTGVKKLKALADSDSEGDIPALQAMLSKTDELYVQVDKVFEQKKMDAVDCPGKRKSINRHANNDVFLEMSEKQLLPFDSKATEKAVWAAVEDIGLQGLQCIKDVDAQIQFHAQHRQETNNTMMISHIVATTGFEKGGFTSGFAYLNRKVARKFVEQDRSVFICTISSHPTLDTPYSCKFGCTLRVIVRSMGEDISLVESYYSVSSHIPANDRAMTSEEFDVVIAGWSEMMQIFTESVESYLLNGNKDALG